MLIHTVLFTLPAEAPASEREALAAGIATLRAIPVVRSLWSGIPAAVTPRPSLLSDYTLALTIVFDDLAAHDAYQAHPLHQAFLASHRHRWSAVRVIDHSG